MKKYKVKTQSFNNKRSLALSLSGPPNMLNNKFYGQGAQGEQIKDVPPQNQNQEREAPESVSIVPEISLSAFKLQNMSNPDEIEPRDSCLNSPGF